MSYIFAFIIFAASGGIGVLVWKYFGGSIKRKVLILLKRDKGEQFWIGLIENDPANPYPYKKLGEWYGQNGQKNFAVRTLRHAYKLDPEDKEITNLLSEVEEV